MGRVVGKQRGCFSKPRLGIQCLAGGWEQGIRAEGGKAGLTQVWSPYFSTPEMVLLPFPSPSTHAALEKPPNPT